VRLAAVVSSAQRRAERLHASWAFSNAGVSLSTTAASSSPRRAAASLTTTVVVAMSACTRATRTRSAGSVWLARVSGGPGFPRRPVRLPGAWLAVADRLPVGQLG
jgi:uncharacterized protein YfiM (DUF2279 family)